MTDPIPMLLWCPLCHARHIDEGEFATKPHHSHSCQSCGLTWRPAIVPTVGVWFLPGFKTPTKEERKKEFLERAMQAGAELARTNCSMLAVPSEGLPPDVYAEIEARKHDPSPSSTEVPPNTRLG